MIAYHEVAPEDMPTILTDGLKRTARGELGDDAVIVATDKLLDKRCPDSLREAGVSRDNNIYAYVCMGNHIIDITDGKALDIDRFVRESEHAVIELQLDPERCYVSDLERYDALKHAVEGHAATSLLDSLADEYWRGLLPLSTYRRDAIQRPEIMITYDIEPSDITERTP